MQLSDFEPCEFRPWHRSLIIDELRAKHGDYIDTEESGSGVDFSPLVNHYGVYKVLMQYFSSCEPLGTGEPGDIQGFVCYLRSMSSECIYQVFYRVEFWPDIEPESTMMKVDGWGGQAIVAQEARELVRLLEREAARISPNEETEAQLYTFQNIFHGYFERARKLLGQREGWKDPLDLATAFFLLVASFEGFLNLVYELYLEPSLRQDVRAREHLNRSPIDVKLRLAPLYCSCFKVRVLAMDEAFKRWQAVINLRNNLIHANLSASMTLREHTEGGVPFLISRDVGKNRYNLPDKFSELKQEHLDFVCETIEQMVESVLSSMKVRYQQELSKVLHRPYFRARWIDDEFVIHSED
jgi:hypothetical protein